jgi:hypothetical protein
MDHFAICLPVLRLGFNHMISCIIDYFAFKTNATGKTAVVQCVDGMARKRAAVVPALRKPPMEMRGQVD